MFFFQNREYWTLVMDVARKNNLKRILRCSQIMGEIFLSFFLELF